MVELNIWANTLQWKYGQGILDKHSVVNDSSLITIIVTRDFVKNNVELDA